MAEKLLHGTDVVAQREQMRRKRMAERVATDAFGQPGAAGRLGHRPLNNRLVQMIARRRSKLRIAADPTCWNTNCQTHSEAACGKTFGPARKAARPVPAPPPRPPDADSVRPRDGAAADRVRSRAA